MPFQNLSSDDQYSSGSRMEVDERSDSVIINILVPSFTLQALKNLVPVLLFMPRIII